MKRLIGSLLVLAALFSVVGAQVPTDANRVRNTVDATFRITAFDEDIDFAAYEIVAENASYAALAAKDSMEAVSSSASDAQRLRISYVKVDSTRKDTILHVNGTTAVSFGDSVLHFQSARIDSGGEAVGTITFRRQTGPATVTTIPAGGMQTYVAHLFAAEREKPYITQWTPSVYTVGDTTVAGRYPLYWNQSATLDTLIGSVSDSTVVFSVQGADFASLLVNLTAIDSDQTDTVSIRLERSVDGTNWSGMTAIDSLLVTAADGTVVPYIVDLLGTTTINAFGSDPSLAPYLRMEAKPVSLAAADSLALALEIGRAASQGFDGAFFELRLYKDFADILDATDGYTVLDRVFLTPSGKPPVTRVLKEAVRVPQYGYVAVFARGKTDGRAVFVSIEGYDAR